MTKEKSYHEPDLENFTGQIYSKGTIVDSDIANSSDIESQKNSYKEKNALAEKIALQECRIKNGSKIVASLSMREAVQKITTFPIPRDFVVAIHVQDGLMPEQDIEQGKFQVFLRINQKEWVRYQFLDFKNHLEKKDFVLVD